MVTMNIVCVDDSDAKTSVQTAKILKRFLFKIGNRTYRGSLTPAKFQKLRNELNSVDRAKLSPINCTKFLDQSLPVDSSLEQLRFQDS